MKIVQPTGCEVYRIQEVKHRRHSPAHDGTLKTTDQSVHGTQLEAHFHRQGGSNVLPGNSTSIKNENMEPDKTRKFSHRRKLSHVLLNNTKQRGSQIISTGQNL